MTTQFTAEDFKIGKSKPHLYGKVSVEVVFRGKKKVCSFYSGANLSKLSFCFLVSGDFEISPYVKNVQSGNELPKEVADKIRAKISEAINDAAGLQRVQAMLNKGEERRRSARRKVVRRHVGKKLLEFFQLGGSREDALLLVDEICVQSVHEG